MRTILIGCVGGGDSSGSRRGGLVLLLLLLLLLLWCCDAVVEGEIVSLNYTDPITQYSKQEFSIVLSTQYSNPFDPQIVDVQLTTLSSNGEKSISNCFYYIPYERVGVTDNITQIGAPSFLCRLTPFVVGLWQFVLSVTDASGTTTQEGNFTVQPLPKGIVKPGVAQVSKKDNKYFVLPKSDGSVNTFFPVGMDMKWGEITEDYDIEIPKFAAAGGNLIRVWMSPEHPSWSFGWYTVEEPWLASSLSNYTSRMPNFWKLDYVFTKCEEYGLSMILIFLDSAHFTSGMPYFAKSPFNTTWGGPLKFEWEIFNNTIAQTYVANVERYVVARYGYSTSLFAWELFNEQDLVTDFYEHMDSALAWHQINYDLVASWDVHGHLITTSFATVNPKFYDIFASVDFINYHKYDAPDMGAYIWSDAFGVVRDFKSAPWLITESGTTWQWTDPHAYARNDPTGIDINNECWASLMAKSGGTAFPFWDTAYIEPQNLYWRFQGIAKFIEGEDLQLLGYNSVYFNVQSPPASMLLDGFNGVWGSPSQNFVVVPYMGQPPNLANISAFQYGKGQAHYYNPPTFEVDSPEGFGVSIVISQAHLATAEIAIDGKIVLSQIITNDTTYHYSIYVVLNFTVPAGPHNITIYNTQPDWYLISNITFYDYAPSVRCYALQSTSKIMGWVSLYNYTWFATLNNFTQPNVPNATVLITNIATGTWTLQWWNTRTGDVVSSYNIGVENGQTNIAVPPIIPSLNISDWSFKLASNTAPNPRTIHIS